MPYNSTQDPYRANMSSPASLGKSGRVVSPDDDEDLDPYCKALVVTAEGNLVVLPSRNADGATITFTGCPVGMIVPYQVRRVLATGTTASVATVD